MYFKNLSFPSEPLIFLSETLRILEEKFGVVITVHDCFGKLCDAEGEYFTGFHMKHRHPFCLHMRKESELCNAQCIRNCLFHVESYAAKQKAPFLHHCWKGAWELIVPVQQNGILQFVFYAGVFRAEKEKPPESMPESAEKLYLALPFPDMNQLKQLEYLLVSFGISLLHSIQEKRPEAEFDRHTIVRRKIREFLSGHIHQNIRLRDLAAALCLSETRTSHLVKRLFAVPFQTMVEEERINRALHLLRNTELPLKAVAGKTGFRNEYYFSRVFRHRCGVPPGKYRKEYCMLRVPAEKSVLLPAER